MTAHPFGGASRTRRVTMTGLAVGAALTFLTTGATAQPANATPDVIDVVSIDPAVPMTTVIQIARVTPQTQDHVAGRAGRVVDVLSRASGFVSGTNLTSYDGERVATYIQFDDSSRAQVERATELLADEVSEADRPRVYEVRVVSRRDGASTTVMRETEDAVAINEATVLPQAQEGVLSEMVARNDEFARSQPAWLSSTFHTSADGSRNVNLGQCADVRGCEAALAATTGGADPAQGGFDPHVYDVVKIERSSR
ncbi:MAG: hypothetical protein ACRCY8_11930 [Dermatophilaceae bacterium]